MQLQDELGDNAEVRACPADAPEQVGVLRLVGCEDTPVRCDYGGLRRENGQLRASEHAREKTNLDEVVDG